jgi:hypothetical protein
MLQNGKLENRYTDLKVVIRTSSLREQQVAKGEVIEVGSDSKDDEAVPAISYDDMLKLCKQLEACSLDVNAECGLTLRRNLHQFRAHIVQEVMKHLVQQTLTEIWGA